MRCEILILVIVDNKSQKYTSFTQNVIWLIFMDEISVILLHIMLYSSTGDLRLSG